MTDNVVDLNGITTLDIPVSRVLKAAMDADMASAIVIGVDEGGEFYFASSLADGADVLWWIEIAKKRLLDTGDV